MDNSPPRQVYCTLPTTEICVIFAYNDRNV